MKRNLLFLVVLMILLIGASCNRDRTAKYMPESSKARAILQTALDGWKTGQPYGISLSDKPKIDVFDARWQAGRKLDNFEILDQIPGLVPPQFSVRMQLAGGQPESLNYLVVGIDPMLVFREADYIRATGQ